MEGIISLEGTTADAHTGGSGSMTSEATAECVADFPTAAAEDVASTTTTEMFFSMDQAACKTSVAIKDGPSKI